jgi:hypothetical protein
MDPIGREREESDPWSSHATQAGKGLVAARKTSHFDGMSGEWRNSFPRRGVMQLSCLVLCILSIVTGASFPSQEPGVGYVNTLKIECGFISHSRFVSEFHSSHRRLPTHSSRQSDANSHGLFPSRRRVCIFRKDNLITTSASSRIPRKTRHDPDQSLRRRLLKVFREVAASILVCTAPAQCRATEPSHIFQDRGVQSGSTHTCIDKKPEARKLLQSALARRNLARKEAYKELRACASSENSVLEDSNGNRKENGQFWKEVRPKKETFLVFTRANCHALHFLYQ